MEKYSVLMSIYKKEHPEYLKLALDSMLHQTIKPDEIVLVEDGPLTDALYAIIKEYKKKNSTILKVVENKKNLGLGLALNVGLKKCRNELVARMDTDDISKPNRCEKQLEIFRKRPELAIVGTYIDEFSEGIDDIISQRRVPCDSGAIYKYAKRRSAFNHPTVMYKKSCVLSVGGYSDLKRNQDVDLFGRMLFSGCKAMNIDESLLWFRCGDELAGRRKSWSNTYTYITTIWRFWKMGYASAADFIIVAIAQIMIYFMPLKLQQGIYKRFLRK